MPCPSFCRGPKPVPALFRGFTGFFVSKTVASCPQASLLSRWLATNPDRISAALLSVSSPLATAAGRSRPRHKTTAGLWVPASAWILFAGMPPTKTMGAPTTVKKTALALRFRRICFFMSVVALVFAAPSLNRLVSGSQPQSQSAVKKPFMHSAESRLSLMVFL